MNIRKTTIICLAVLAVAVLVSCGSKTETAAVEAAEVRTATPVRVQKVALSSITDYRDFGGTVTAHSSAPVLPMMAGEVKNITVKVGDKVEKNQVLGYVDPSRDGQVYNLSKIKAPISGTVTTLKGIEGTMTSQSSVFAMVETLDDLEISFSVIERYVTKVNEGNKVLVSFDAIPGEVFAATISEANPTMDVMTRTRSVKAKLDNPEPRLIAGMYAHLSVITEEKDNVIVVPYSSLVISQAETYCYNIKGDTAHKTVVTTGIREGNNVEITSGLSVNDLIVTKGKDLLNEGALVKVLD